MSSSRMIVKLHKGQEDLVTTSTHLQLGNILFGENIESFLSRSQGRQRPLKGGLAFCCYSISLRCFLRYSLRCLVHLNRACPDKPFADALKPVF
jgi:hypothetical protein